MFLTISIKSILTGVFVGLWVLAALMIAFV